MAATTMQKKQLREMVAEQARNMAALEMKTAAANPRCSESGAAEKTGSNVLHEHDKGLQDTKNPNCNCEPPPAVLARLFLHGRLPVCNVHAQVCQHRLENVILTKCMK